MVYVLKVPLTIASKINAAVVTTWPIGYKSVDAVAVVIASNACCYVCLPKLYTLVTMHPR